MMATPTALRRQGREACAQAAGDDRGQMFDIADCEDAELVVMDHCEQSRCEVKNSRVFVGACEAHVHPQLYGLHFLRCLPSAAS